METTSTTLSFSYDALDTVTRSFVQQKANECHLLLKRSAKDIIAIGRNLLAVKACLPYGSFLAWLRAEMGLKERTARRFMSVARRFAACTDWVESLSPTVLYELASPTTSDAILQQIVQRHIAPTLAAIQAAKRAERLHRDVQSLSQSKQTDLEASNHSMRALHQRLFQNLQPSDPATYASTVERQAGTTDLTTRPLPDADVHQEVSSREEVIQQHDEVQDASCQDQTGYQSWQEAIALLSKDLDHCLAQWPMMHEARTVGIEDWAHLWRVQTLVHRLTERCFQWTQSLALDGLPPRFGSKAE